MHGDVGYFSIAVGAFGIGGLLAAISLLGLDGQRNRRPITSVFAMGYGLIVLLASQATSVWGLTLLFACAGYAMTMSNTSANTVLQSATSIATRGQTVSMFMLVMRGGIALGGLLTGITVSLLGVRNALLINGILAMLLQSMVAIYWLHNARVRPGLLHRPRR